MKHQVKTKKLSRTKPHREAMLANMANSLFTHRTIKTTEAKAKELRRVTDRLIATAKKNTLAARRQVFAQLRDETIVKKLFDEIAPHFSDRPSGFTRVLKVGVRHGDGGAVSLVELLTPKPEVSTDKDKDKKKKK
ncbi:MAG: 50S ribosomal protein L17 [candidate division Zixibacteria bacterium]|nr:50S ribosomal protein L17 [candidate division Zixibacteria bacterium]